MQHLLLIPSCTPVLELSLLARDCQRKLNWVFSYLRACLKSERHVTCDLLETSLATTTDNGYTREETEKDVRKSSGATVSATFWSDPTQHVR